MPVRPSEHDARLGVRRQPPPAVHASVSGVHPVSYHEPDLRLCLVPLNVPQMAQQEPFWRTRVHHNDVPVDERGNVRKPPVNYGEAQVVSWLKAIHDPRRLCPLAYFAQPFHPQYTVWDALGLIDGMSRLIRVRIVEVMLAFCSVRQI